MDNASEKIKSNTIQFSIGFTSAWGKNTGFPCLFVGIFAFSSIWFLGGNEIHIPSVVHLGILVFWLSKLFLILEISCECSSFILLMGWQIWWFFCTVIYTSGLCKKKEANIVKKRTKEENKQKKKGRKGRRQKITIFVPKGHIMRHRNYVLSYFIIMHYSWQLMMHGALLGCTKSIKTFATNLVFLGPYDDAIFMSMFVVSCCKELNASLEGLPQAISTTHIYYEHSLGDWCGRRGFRFVTSMDTKNVVH